MSTWTAPITWANGAVTAASMNAEIRDHLNFLKGWADLITDSTTADTGTVTLLHIVRPSSAGVAFSTRISGDTQDRLQIRADGSIYVGSGADAIGDDRLYRSAIGRIQTDNHFRASQGLSTLTKAGTISDADFTNTPPIGTIAIDTTNLKIYVRTASATWKTVTVA